MSAGVDVRTFLGQERRQNYNDKVGLLCRDGDRDVKIAEWTRLASYAKHCNDDSCFSRLVRYGAFRALLLTAISIAGYRPVLRASVCCDERYVVKGHRV